jgi:uncharacterized protein YfkK (UPF0435 family)
MDTFNDENFILWIANRLVFKYKENPEILLITKNIVQQYKEIKQSILDHEKFTLSIDQQLKEIQNFIQKKQTTNIQPLKERIISANKNKYKNTFDNLDIDNLLN